MTYGEYYYLIKYDMRLMNGVWVANKPRVTIPTRMKRDEAMIYYCKKFAKFWILKQEEIEKTKEADV